MWWSAANAIYMLWAKPRGAIHLANANFGTTITPHVAVARPDEYEMLWHPIEDIQLIATSAMLGAAGDERSPAPVCSSRARSSRSGRPMRPRSRARRHAPIRPFGQPELPREEICLCVDGSIECRARIFENAEVAAGGARRRPATPAT